MLVMIFEKQRNEYQMMPFSETLWTIMIMITTTGFGDYAPITPMGRIMSITACIVGVGIMSLFIVSLTHSSYLNNNENIVYSLVTSAQTFLTCQNMHISFTMKEGKYQKFFMIPIRLVQMHQPQIEDMLESMYDRIASFELEIQYKIDKFDLLHYQVEEIRKQSEQVKKVMTRCKALSFQTLNLAKLMDDYRGQMFLSQISDLRKTKKLTTNEIPDELKKLQDLLPPQTLELLSETTLFESEDSIEEKVGVDHKPILKQQLIEQEIVEEDEENLTTEKSQDTNYQTLMIDAQAGIQGDLLNTNSKEHQINYQIQSDQPSGFKSPLNSQQQPRRKSVRFDISSTPKLSDKETGSHQSDQSSLQKTNLNQALSQHHQQQLLIPEWSYLNEDLKSTNEPKICYLQFK
ncbi:UNKNOWN [Stylonychia lemnae]|uniref:Potassium channel domain-containing protein n=1 Tax=Stylonychia lemnae TaxID=5949 RepID=A0A078AI70_STYLE|nr:UNKNOWN [Stylonychia lemnae]|eukprot:CDW81631.1 UNKNOWN [Stylonychia lemnae]